MILQQHRDLTTSDEPVSYTHLDVYKRQVLGSHETGGGQDRYSRKRGTGKGDVADDVGARGVRPRHDGMGLGTRRLEPTRNGVGQPGGEIKGRMG